VALTNGSDRSVGIPIVHPKDMKIEFVDKAGFRYNGFMNTGDPSPEMNIGRSMTEAETRAFLQERNIQPLHDWQPHQPLLYVLEERLRGDDGRFNDLPPERRPSIVRIDDPTNIRFDQPIEDMPDRVVYGLENEGGQSDYFAIDPLTQQIVLVKTSKGRIKTNRPYHVVKGGLFMPSDELFPRSN